MNRFKVSLVILIILFFTGCKKEININADWKEIPAVYCILNPHDTVQYLRLGRSFRASPEYEHSALQADSISYKPDDVEVYLNKMENGIPVGPDLYFVPTNEIPKDSGMFTSHGYFIFSLHGSIQKNTEYKLTINFTKKNLQLISEIITLDELIVLEPNSIEQRKVDFTHLNGFSVQWKPLANASIYQVVVAFKYCEITASDSINKILLWQSNNKISGLQTSDLSLEIPGDPGFYNFLVKNLSVNTQIKRRVLGLDFIVLAGGSELADYVLSSIMSANDPSVLNIYSNIQNGVGIFSSKTDTKISNKLFSDNTIDSLSYGRITKDLNFANHYGMFH